MPQGFSKCGMLRSWLRHMASRFTSVHKPCEWMRSHPAVLARSHSSEQRRKLPQREPPRIVTSMFGSNSICGPSLGRATLKMLTRQPDAAWAAAQAARLMTDPAWLRPVWGIRWRTRRLESALCLTFTDESMGAHPKSCKKYRNSGRNLARKQV